MIDTWRELLYPLGFLSSAAFSARMLLQWLTSEVKGKSVVMPAFWQLSLAGNSLLALHAFIQLQFHVCIVQVCNGIISWRNLDLMRPQDKQFTLQATFKIMAISVFALILVFFLQSSFAGAADSWFRVPSTPWQSNADLNISWQWHLIGSFGLILFGGRFWIQWWFAERKNTSYLGTAFWWTSLLGESLCLIYFLKIHDPVNFIGPAFGLIPYIRNLMLIRKKSSLKSEG